MAVASADGYSPGRGPGWSLAAALPVSAAASHRVVEAVWRLESARIVAALIRMVGDVGAAEELAQDAVVAALETWPRSGIPDNPGAWLMAAAKRRAIDALRRRRRLDRKLDQLGRDAAARTAPVEPVPFGAGDIDDDVLRLVFIACQPVLPPEGRVALTLRLVGGLTTAAIARAYLVPESTVAQRIVRAKRALAASGARFAVPEGAERQLRLASVLEVVYLIFNEGYAASAGASVLRPELVGEALRLGRVLAALMPAEAEVHGLVALMELQASRSRARVAASGEPVPLLEQERGLWDQLLIHRGLAALHRAYQVGAGAGRYTVQAAIAACHARSPSAAETPWPRIAELYGTLVQLTGSPVVELNRAVAVGMAHGPAAGLELVEAIAGERALARYHLLPAVRGDLLARLGRLTEAGEQFTLAAAMTGNERERAVLLGRAAACGLDDRSG